MKGWHGGPFSIGVQVEASAFYQDSRGCFHLIVRSGDKLLHYVRGSRDPYPWDEGRQIQGSYKGSGQVEITSFGNLEIYWPQINGDIIHQYANPLSFPDPSAGAIVKLDPNLTVPKMIERFGYPIMICPTLIPTYGIEKSLDEDLFCERYLNRGAKDGLFNAMRFFSFGVWEDFTAPRVLFPYNKTGNKFDCFSRNPEWIETLDRRIGQCIERGFTPIITLIDNCSLHTYSNSHWGLHPWNGKNNINNSSEWNGSVYHFYEEEHQSPEMKVTAKIIEEHVRFVVSYLNAKYGSSVMFEECNESHAGEGWHRILRDWLKEEGVSDDNRILTSMDTLYVEKYDEYPYLSFYKKQIHTYLNYACHGIQDMDGFNWMDTEWIPRGVRFLASEDGLYPQDPPGPPWPPYREFVKEILGRGALGFEHNERPLFHDNIFNPDLWDWNKIKEIADGWKDFLK